MYPARGSTSVLNPTASTNQNFPTQETALLSAQSFQVTQVGNVDNQPSSAASKLPIAIYQTTTASINQQTPRLSFKMLLAEDVPESFFDSMTKNTLNPIAFFTQYETFLLTSWICEPRKRLRLIDESKLQNVNQSYHALIELQLQNNLRFHATTLIHHILNLGKYCVAAEKKLTIREIGAINTNKSKAIKAINLNYQQAYKSYEIYLKQKNVTDIVIQTSEIDILSAKNKQIIKNISKIGQSSRNVKERVSIEEEMPANEKYLTEVLKRIKGGTRLESEDLLDLARLYIPHKKHLRGKRPYEQSLHASETSSSFLKRLLFSTTERTAPATTQPKAAENINQVSTTTQMQTSANQLFQVSPVSLPANDDPTNQPPNLSQLNVQASLSEWASSQDLRFDQENKTLQDLAPSSPPDLSTTTQVPAASLTNDRVGKVQANQNPDLNVDLDWSDLGEIIDEEGNLLEFDFDYKFLDSLTDSNN